MTGKADLGDGGFEALLEAAPDGILVVDERGHILLANQRAEQLFGHAPGALVGLGVDSLVPERFRQGHRGRREGYLADPHPRPMGIALELYGRRRDGVEFPVEISLSSLPTADGMRVITIVRDVSERRALKAESEALRQRSLQAVSDVALRNLAPDALLRAVLRPVSEALGAGVVAISISQAGEAPRVRAALGLEPEIIGREILIGTEVRRGPAVHRGVAELVEALPDTLISSPLVLGDEVIGVVIAGRRSGPLLGEDDAALLGRLAERIGLAVGQGRLYEAAQAAETRLREILGAVADERVVAAPRACSATRPRRGRSRRASGSASWTPPTARTSWRAPPRPAPTAASTSWSTACAPPTAGPAGCAIACV